MTNLYRLRELAALFQPKCEVQPVLEASLKPSASFVGIKAIVDDALGDLHDKLSEGGALETLLDKAGLTDLDNNADPEGSTILQKLSSKTEEFKKEIEDLMVEIELLLVSAE
jgi:hypothetical protein